MRITGLSMEWIGERIFHEFGFEMIFLYVNATHSEDNNNSHILSFHCRKKTTTITQETIVPVYKTILLMTKDAFHGVAKQFGFGSRCGCKLMTIFLWNKTYYVFAMVYSI